MSGTGTSGNTLQLVCGTIRAPHPTSPVFIPQTVYAAGANPNIFIGHLGTSQPYRSPHSGPTTAFTDARQHISILCSNVNFLLWTGTSKQRR